VLTDAFHLIVEKGQGRVGGWQLARWAGSVTLADIGAKHVLGNDPSRAQQMNKRIAVAIALLLPCVAYAAVVLLTDRIFCPKHVSPGRERRAALAIRDNVTPFEKWGSRQFTWPYLKAGYDAFWYFTQTSAEDSREAFVRQLQEALERYPEVDLYLLAHHNHYLDWVAQVPAPARSRLRLVYNTGCRDLRQRAEWLDLGAGAYVGHPGQSMSPVFYFFFLRRWTRGYTLGEAINEANQLMRFELNLAKVLTLGNLRAARVYQASAAVGTGRLQLQLDGSEGSP